jgi:hypothetical protein
LLYKASTDASGNEYLGFCQISLIPILTSVLQSKSKIISQQQEQLTEQQTVNATLISRIDTLTSQVATLMSSMATLKQMFNL